MRRQLSIFCFLLLVSRDLSVATQVSSTLFPESHALILGTDQAGFSGAQSSLGMNLIASCVRNSFENKQQKTCLTNPEI